MIASWKRGFDVARAASLLSDGPQTGYRLGAALYAGSNLLSIGCNNWNKTTPYSKNTEFNGNVHAEISCLVRRRHYDHSNNMILYISRTTTNALRTESQDACSRPCTNCLNLIKISGVRRIRFFNEQGEPTEIKL